jgi:hypothetical protein
MSNELEEKIKEVVLGIEDVKNLREFFGHFKIKIDPSLEEAIFRCEQKNSLDIEDQEDLKIGLCLTMINSEHLMFKDELFATVINNAKKAVFDTQFQKELEKQLTTES